MAVRKTPSRRSSGSSSGGSKSNKWWLAAIVGLVIYSQANDGDDKGSKPPTTGTSNICTETFKGGC